MYNVKNRAGQRSAKKEVMEDTDHAYQLMNICTDTMVCLAFFNLNGTEDIDDIKPGQDPEEWLLEQSKEVVDLVWPEIDTNNISMVAQDHSGADQRTEDETFCICKSTYEDLESMYMTKYNRA